MSEHVENTVPSNQFKSVPLVDTSLEGDPNVLYTDPHFVMKDPYAEHATPKTAQEARLKEMDVMRETDLKNMGIRTITGSDGKTYADLSNWKYASSTMAYAPEQWQKTTMRIAQMSGMNNTMTDPMWFSPLHTPQNWQIAAKRREVYNWCRFFYSNEPKVGAAIDFYSQFAMNNFKLECSNRKIEKWFEHNVKRKLRLNNFCKEVSSEYFTIGDVFVHRDIECGICGGTAKNPDTGEVCNHPGGTIGKMMILNPDYVEVQNIPLLNEPQYAYIPDEELKNVVQYRQPKAIFDALPDSVKIAVMTNKPIPLSKRTISHLKHMPVPYGTYGSSLLRRLFTTLAYKTKIMTANWIVAERLILPVRVVKIGSDARPAVTADIIDVQQQLSGVANDPNMTIVTHHNFEYEWFGASGKILQVTQELEHIDKEILDGMMLNEALLNGEGCIPAEDRILTRNGFKNLNEIRREDEIATFNKETQCLEYQKAEKIHEYDFDGNLIQFRTNKIDFLCTPNHRMLFQKRDHDEWVVDVASNVRDRAKFYNQIKWEAMPAPEFVMIDEQSIPIDHYLRLLALYVTEGYVRFATEDECQGLRPARSLHIYQTHKGKAFGKCCDLFPKLPWKYTHDTKAGAFHIYNSVLAAHMKNECGHGSYVKYIPSWIKTLPVEKLKIFLSDLMDGDGAYKNEDSYTYSTYYTRSKSLCQDVVEIALKCGYWPRFTHSEDRGYEISFSDFDLDRNTYTLESKKFETISEMPYCGKVWCVTVPNGFIITERNGRLMISGNSGYQSGAVGVEALIRRLESWRDKLSEWIEEEIFKPIAQMQGFIDEEATRELGQTVWLYPTIKWNDLNLRDKSQLQEKLLALHDKMILSSRTLLESFGFNYDQEVKRLRYEQVAVGPQGGMLGGQGGGMGGMGGGGMGGGMGGMGGPMGGAGGPAGGGGGGAGGGMDSMGIGPGMMPPAGPMAGGSKVMKKGKGKESAEDQIVPMTPVKLTGPEQDMAEMLVDVASVLKIDPRMIRVQFPVDNPNGGKPFPLDFAFPTLKIGVECLHPDTPVMTSKGARLAKDIKADDLLIDRHGNPTAIVNKFVGIHDGVICEVKAQGCVPIKITDRHKLLVAKSQATRVYRKETKPTRTRGFIVPSKPEFVMAKDIVPGDFLLIPKPLHDKMEVISLVQYRGTAHNAHLLPDTVNMDGQLGRLLGLYTAKGCCTNNGTIWFSFGEHEHDLIEETQVLMDEIFGLQTESVCTDRGSTIICYSNAQLTRFLADSIGKRSYEKQVFYYAFESNDEFKREYIRGLVDGDGCHRSDTICRIQSNSLYLSLGIQRLAASMSTMASICKSSPNGTYSIEGRAGPQKTIWETSFNLAPQKKSCREDDQYLYVRIKSIKHEHYHGAIINFETQDHSYCINNIVSKNCDGKIWHDNPQQASHDKERDQLLAMRGWTVLRFDDKVIDEAPQAVKSVLSRYITQAFEKQKSKKKEASVTKAYYYTSYAGKAFDVYEAYDKAIRSQRG